MARIFLFGVTSGSDPGVSLLFGEGAEIVEAGGAPLFGVVELVLQTRIDFLPALIVDLGLGLTPDADEILNLFHATGVAVLHLFVDGAAALEAIGPGHMVEPEQVALGTGADIVVERTVGLAILGGGVGTGVGAVETDAETIGLMVIDGAPLEGIGGDEAAGLGTIVLVEGEDVMEADGHHVVDAGFS